MPDGSAAPEAIPFLSIEGDAEAIGHAHGVAFADRIAAMIDLYGRYFGRPEADVFSAARHFRGVIGDYNPAYLREIEAMADAADLDPLWIVALNARSELLSTMGLNECTALHFAGSPVMGQNWDWEKSLEDLIVVMRIEAPDAPTVVMMTEPGIIGKIGLNSAGVGVCFNFLPTSAKTDGVPVHVVLRSLLDAPGWDEATARLKGAGTGRSANILIGHKSGESLDMEFTGDGSGVVPAQGTFTLHTNHYVACDMPVPEAMQASTLGRYETAQRLAGSRSASDVAALKQILASREGEEPILVPYRPRDFLGEIGTVCTIVMDLEACTFSIRNGNDPAGAFTDYAVN